jgi:hypothetical protein
MRTLKWPNRAWSHTTLQAAMTSKRSKHELNLPGLGSRSRHLFGRARRASRETPAARPMGPRRRIPWYIQDTRSDDTPRTDREGLDQRRETWTRPPTRRRRSSWASPSATTRPRDRPLSLRDWVLDLLLFSKHKTPTIISRQERYRTIRAPRQGRQRADAHQLARRHMG